LLYNKHCVRAPRLESTKASRLTNQRYSSTSATRFVSSWVRSPSAKTTGAPGSRPTAAEGGPHPRYRHQKERSALCEWFTSGISTV